ncbi:MAG: glycosyltransferase [Alphaproteobacteria bacterium]|nr:glycosyltransferase [Alphaproteobacteria bacterium]
MLLIHPAWHSCGSHQVFVTQAQAYRHLGAKVLSLALVDIPGRIEGSTGAQNYLAATEDLEADVRLLTALPWAHIFRRDFLKSGLQWLRGNSAAIGLEVAKSARLPHQTVAGEPIALIHCNHFFCLPAALRLRGERFFPIFLDTHDIQARQYALRNSRNFRLPPVLRYQEMLELELSILKGADLLIHLNAEEADHFQALIPDQSHALLYPAVAAMPMGSGGGPPILVASANYTNFLSLSWFLREVLPHASEVPVQIYGNIDHELKLRAPELYKAHAKLFHGRVEMSELHTAYERACAVLLPATAGHGISIKTVEAMSTGAPLIATLLAFRGLGLDLAALANVCIAEDGASFAAALCQAYAGRSLPGPARQMVSTRQIYEKRFAIGAYQKSLWNIVEGFLRFENHNQAQDVI